MQINIIFFYTFKKRFKSMVQQVTRGIKISVQTDFEGTFYRYVKLMEFQNLEAF